MYYIQKKIEISASHRLTVDYESKCSQLHGHNWVITVYCKGDKLNANGMLVDFNEIKDKVAALDHADLNRILYPFNPTAENVARELCKSIPCCYRVDVQETENNIATYENEDI